MPETVGLASEQPEAEEEAGTAGSSHRLMLPPPNAVPGRTTLFTLRLQRLQHRQQLLQQQQHAPVAAPPQGDRLADPQRRATLVAHTPERAPERAPELGRGAPAHAPPAAHASGLQGGALRASNTQVGGAGRQGRGAALQAAPPEDLPGSAALSGILQLGSSPFSAAGPDCAPVEAAAPRAASFRMRRAATDTGLLLTLPAVHEGPAPACSSPSGQPLTAGGSPEASPAAWARGPSRHAADTESGRAGGPHAAHGGSGGGAALLPRLLRSHAAGGAQSTGGGGHSSGGSAQNSHGSTRCAGGLPCRAALHALPKGPPAHAWVPARCGADAS